MLEIIIEIRHINLNYYILTIICSYLLDYLIFINLIFQINFKSSITLFNSIVLPPFTVPFVTNKLNWIEAIFIMYEAPQIYVAV